MGRVPAEHKSEHFLEGFLLGGCGVLIEVDRAMHLAGVRIDQISHDDGLEAAHIHLPIVAVLDVGEISSVAAAMIRVAVGTARTCIGGALALGHADALHIEVGDLLGHALGIVGGDGQSGERE